LKNATQDPKVQLDQDRMQSDRRAALKKIGKFAAYVAPTMIAMMASEEASATCIHHHHDDCGDN
jgi:hypothetical protein